MKNKIFPFNKATKVIALSICLAIAGSASAQTLVTPYPVPTELWDNVPNSSSGVYVAGLNTAMILCDHTSAVPICAYACWDGGSTYYADISIFGDASVGQFSSATALPTAVTVTGTPDIVLTNYPGSSTKFYAVIAYPTSTGFQVDYYTFTETAGDIIPASFTWIASSTNATAMPAVVHIDGIADFSSTMTTGYPFCDYIVVTWDDPGISGHVFASAIDLSVVPPATITGTTIGTGISPDVAAIKRTVGLAHDNFALITYTNTSSTELLYNEWNITASLVSTTTTLDAGTVGSPIVMPRIDAIDDYNNNATSSGHANYKIAAQVDSNSTYLIRTYDNTLIGGSPSFWDCSDVVDFSTISGGGFSGPSYNHYLPAVAMGGPYPSSMHTNDGTQYMVTDFVHYTTDSDILMMEPIDYSNSTSIADQSGNYNYYWVSDSPAINTYNNYANSVSSPANSQNSVGSSIVAWGNPVSASGGTDIEYKTSPYAGSYQFRQAQNGTILPGTPAKDWQAYPNPAGNYLIVNDPGAAGSSGSYLILDMTGKTILQGSLVSGNQQIAIGGLPPGNYILKLSRDNGDGKNYMITKDEN